MFSKKIAKWISCVMLSSFVLFTGEHAAYAADVSEDTLMIEDLADVAEDESDPDAVLTDENIFANDVITGMDEDGNIYEWNQEVTEYEGLNPYMRTVEPLIVDFHTKDVRTNTYYTEVSTGKRGYTNGAYGADAVYLGTVDGKIKFMMSGVVGLVDTADVRLIEFANVSSYGHYQVNSSGRLIHYITTSVTGTSYANRLDNGPAPSYLQPGTKYLSYDGHYFYTVDQFATMQSDYNAGTREHAVNASTPYFNYFQYLPMRSFSDYSASEFDSVIAKNTSASSKMRNLGVTFTSCEYTYGVNALLTVSIAANESAWGSSNICQSKNNLFGINAIDSSPGTSATTFATPNICVKDYMETYISKRYCRPSYGYYNGGFLGNKASGMNLEYASDPYWGEKAAAIAWRLDSAGGSRDAYKYTIGIKNMISTDHTNVNVRSGSSLSNSVLYETSQRSQYAVLLDSSKAENGFYKIQSDGVLNAERTGLNPGTGNYQMGSMYAYISSKYVTVVSQSKRTDTIEYAAHIGDAGWMPRVSDGELAGSVGQAHPMEAISIDIGNVEGLGVKYRAHVRNIGWQDFVTDGTLAGTTGNALSIEALEISLTGEKADQYDIYYSAHVANIGWLGWAKNGAPAGSSGYAYPMEAIKIKVVKKGAEAPGSTSNAYVQKGVAVEVKIPTINAQAHVSEIGWMKTVTNGEVIGTTGKALPLESLKLSVKDNSNLGISYSAHVRNVGWMKTVSNGAEAGTTGRALSIEALKINLTGADADKFDIYYRLHVRNKGWLGWAKNGEVAGTSGYALPAESLEIRVVKKGDSAPGTTKNAYLKK